MGTLSGRAGKRRSRQALDRRLTQLENKIDAAMLLNAAAQSRFNSALQTVSSLAQVEFCVSSQWGEDGILDWIISRLPAIPERFVEFGVQDYTESNTRFLLRKRNWRGLVLDSSPDHIRFIKKDAISWHHDLTATEAFITADNINSLISGAGFSGELGLLSIDIDGNDYWIWEAIHCVAPVIVVCEYNAVFGDRHPVTVPYHPSFSRMDAHHSGQYYGASIGALQHLAQSRGYAFLGTNSAGNNAFFIHSRYAGTILAQIGTPKIHASRFSDMRDQNGHLTPVHGPERFQAIAHLPVVHVGTKEERTLASLETVYSEAFLLQMSGLEAF